MCIHLYDVMHFKGFSQVTLCFINIRYISKSLMFWSTFIHCKCFDNRIYKTYIYSHLSAAQFGITIVEQTSAYSHFVYRQKAWFVCNQSMIICSVCKSITRNKYYQMVCPLELSSQTVQLIWTNSMVISV